MAVVDSQNVSAQQQIALDTHAIFAQSCFNCHGPDGAYKETLLMEHNELISENGPVVPGNPEASRLYKRLLGEGGQLMPLGGPPLPNSQIEAVKNWILVGAPDWAATSTTDDDFISPAEILNTIETHLMSLSSFDRAFARYFTMTHLYNAGESPSILQEYRKGLNKLVNSLSWGSAITNPQPIDSHGTIFYIDLRHYEWDVNNAWTQIEAEYPYHISFDAPTQTALKAQLERLQGEMQADIPAIHVDWFVAQASLPPLYHDLLSLPLTDRELETRLEVDVIRNLLNAPGVRVWRAGTNNSGVSNNNRAIERHTSRYGAYWKSYDFAGSVGTQNIFTHPLSFTHDGGEVVFNLPNGLQAYYVTNASGFRLDDAPINIVSNPAASDPTVRNGLSCFGCHTEGMKTFEDQVRSVIEGDATPAYDKEQALRLYVEQSQMDTLLREDMDRYRAALEKTGGQVDDIEPISRFHEAFEGSVNAAYAASVVGLEKATFLAKVRENEGLQNVGLLVLDSPTGRMKRDAWADSFDAIIFALDFPDSITPPTDSTPSGVVHIPDRNLHIAIAEALGKKPNAPITIEDMETLTKLGAQERDIQDLTGIQFATNLRELYIRDNNISDLSPIANLITLQKINIDRNPIANSISYIKNLTNLESITCTKANLSNLSAFTGLTNLKAIHGWGNPISDISPLAGLTKLKHLYLPVGNISDLTPLSNLTELEGLFLHDQKISDISPLANLTRLEELTLYGNKISDISPLTNLTNLKRVGLQRNNISDISPIDREGIQFAWDTNPGFPKYDPSIEGPWLWLVLPDTTQNINTDTLSRTSRNTINEIDIATHGAIEGSPVEEQVWTAHKLLSSDNDNRSATILEQTTQNTVIYGTISLHSPYRQETTMFANNNHGLKVYLNQTVVYKKEAPWTAGGAHKTFFPVTLEKGRNILLVAMKEDNEPSRIHFSFKPGTEYTVSKGIGYTFSQTPIHIGDTFTLDIRAENITDLAGWQFDIAFDPAMLEALNVTEGDFLKQNGANTFSQSGSINNGTGRITGLNALRLSPSGVTGTGTLLKVDFKAKREGETTLILQNVLFASAKGESIAVSPHETCIVIEGQLATGDVNRDGVINIIDLVLVSRQLNQRVPAGSAVDLNGDGIVNILDLLIVSQAITPAAPLTAGDIDSAMIETWIAEARIADDGSLAFKQGIKNLEALLRSLIPETDALLRNYPNPFNPETWIPYHLAQSADVQIAIYDVQGGLVRRLELGYQQPGYYADRIKAAYWDGRNQLGESVASGLYFYTLTTGKFTATRRMVILK